MEVAEELVREFLVYRGFTNTLHAFEKELATDIGKGFHVDKILHLIFSVYIPKFEANKLIDLLSFFKKCFSHADDVVSKLNQSILRYYIVNAVKCKRKDKVLEFFDSFGHDLMRRDESWSSWFAIPYLQNPHLDPQFVAYFSEEWFRALHLSLRNFLSEMLNGTRTPALLKISAERDTMKHLKQEIKQLTLKLSQTQSLLEETEALLRQSRSVAEAAKSSPGVSHDTHANSASQVEEKERLIGDLTEANFNNNADESRSSDARQDFVGESVASSSFDSQNEEDFPDVKPVFQDTFLGHTSPISCSRFSASGNNIASASIDGQVRIWTYDPSAPTSRNATIYCGAEIMSLEWDCKSDRLQ